MILTRRHTAFHLIRALHHCVVMLLHAVCAPLSPCSSTRHMDVRPVLDEEVHAGAETFRVHPRMGVRGGGDVRRTGEGST